MKQTFLQFQNEIRGYDFYDKKTKVPRYLLYWSRYKSSDLLNNKTKFLKKDRLLIR